MELKFTSQGRVIILQPFATQSHAVIKLDIFKVK